MHFRENLQKSGPHFFQKKTAENNTKKQHKQKQKQKHNKKNTKKQEQTQQAENCESVYWHTQIAGNLQGPRLRKKG